MSLIYKFLYHIIVFYNKIIKNSCIQPTNGQKDLDLYYFEKNAHFYLKIIVLKK